MGLKTDEPVHKSQKVQNVHERNYGEKAIESFKQQLREIDLAKLKNSRVPMKHINIFFKHLLQFMIIFSQKYKYG